MCKVGLLAPICLALCVPLPAIGTMWYVDGSVSASGDGVSWETAFKKIQEGIDAADHGDMVMVKEGTYVENIKFNGKNIILTSTDPLDAAVVANTIIDGNQAGSVVTFSGVESQTCVLSGFTIQNGLYDDGGGICGGTLEGNRTRATIQNNVITKNDRSGLRHCDGVIQNNDITGNSSGSGGGGLWHCYGTIQNNAIRGNWASWGGWGIVCLQGHSTKQPYHGEQNPRNRRGPVGLQRHGREQYHRGEHCWVGRRGFVSV